MIAPCTLGIMTNLMRFEKKENKIIYELKQHKTKAKLNTECLKEARQRGRGPHGPGECKVKLKA